MICSVLCLLIHFISKVSLKRMRYFRMSLWGSQKGWTVISRVLSLHFCLRTERIDTSHPTAVNEAMPKKREFPWDAVSARMDACYWKTSLENLPSGSLLKSQRPPELSLSTSSSELYAAPASRKVSPNGPDGFFQMQVHTPPGWVLSLC